MLLGALLISDGLCSTADVSEALESQKTFGGRLGTSLVENGAIEIDVLAAALGRQLSMPPALLHHFKRVDASVLQRVPRKLAEKHRVIPIGPPPAAPMALALAILEPLSPYAFDDLAFVASARIIPMIAPELRIFQALEKFYGVANADGGVFLRMGKAGRRKRALVGGAELRSIPPAAAAPTPAASASRPAPPVQSLDMPDWPSRPAPSPPLPDAAPESAPALSVPASAELFSTPTPTHLASDREDEGAIDLEVLGPASVAAASSIAMSRVGAALRRSSLAVSSVVRAIDDLFDATIEIPDSLFAPTERRMLAAAPAADTWISGDASSERSSVKADVAALDAIAQATEQDEVGDALAGYLRDRFEVGLVLLLRGDTARGWRGFALAGIDPQDGFSIGKIGVSIAESPLLREAFRSNSVTHAAPVDSAPFDRDHLWRPLRCEVPSDAVVAPIVAGDRLVALVVALALDGATIGAAAIEELAALTKAAGVAWNVLAEATL
ncbi:MAG: hypothetical protein ACHREM_17550 [Polyangiales bacterium]